MEIDKIIRERIKEYALEKTGRKVRCVFFIAKTLDNVDVYGIHGNNSLFAIAKVDPLGNINLIY